MSEERELYTEFLTGAPSDDLLSRALPMHMKFMPLIIEKDPHRAPMVGRMIDVLVGATLIQHLEAAIREPMLVPDVIRMLREEIGKKIESVDV